jgi:anti-repressor protein
MTNPRTNKLFTLVKHQVADELIETVNARELHAFLEVGTQFKDWITRRIEDYGFTVGIDFCSFLSESTGGRPSIEYHITLDMAKELSMVERNAKGKEARQYFIDCEKQAIASTPKLPVSYVEALECLVASEKEKLVLTHQLEVAAPKIAFAEAVASSDDLILVRDLAKLIAGNGVDIGEKRLYTWLRENRYLMSDNSPYQSAMDRGLFKVTESIYKQGNQTKITKTTRITTKGQQYLLAKFL